MKQVVNIFVIHTEKLAIRKQRIEALFTLLDKSDKYEFVKEYILQHEPDQINQNIMKSLFSTEKVSDEDFAKVPFMPIASQASCVLKHSIAITKASMSKNFSLIVEDDVLFNDNILERLEAIIGQCGNESFFYLGMPLHKNVIGDDELVDGSEHYKIFPSCESYLLSPEVAKKILSVFYPIKFNANVQLSWAMKLLDMKPKIVKNSIFLDGSKFGTYLGSHDTNTFLPYNMDFVRMYHHVNKMDLTNKELVSKTKDEISNMTFKNHPAVLNLHAQFLILIKEYPAANVLLNNAFDILKQNNCTINGSNPILQTLISIQTHLQ